MKRLAALLVFTFALAACGGTVDEPVADRPARQAAPLIPPPESTRGVQAADGRSSFEVAGGELRRLSTLTGEVTRTYALDGDWELSGVSATGAWAVLQRGDTDVLVLDTKTGKTAHRVELSGDFRVETISAAGDFLFLQQDFVDGSYAVRGYDLAAGQMLPGSLGSKGALVKMQGLPSQVVASPDGRWLLTLYVNTQTNTAFVHALNLIERIAICINMPPCIHCNRETLGKWGLALAPDGRTLYGANAAAGRIATIYLPTSSLIADNVFSRSPGGPTRATVSKDGSKLLFTNGASSWSFDPASNAVQALADEA